MSNIWYYAEGDKSVGPLSLEDLAAVLSAMPDAGEVLVWRDGLPEWEEAKNLPELVAYVGGEMRAREPNWIEEQAPVATERATQRVAHRDRRARSNPAAEAGEGGSARRPGRGRIALILSVYLLVALAFNLYLQLRQPLGSFATIWFINGSEFPSRAWMLILASGAGAGLAHYLISGLLPMLGWSLGRFRVRNAAAPLVIWLLLGCAYGYVSERGDWRADREKELKNYKTGCIGQQRKAAASGRFGVSDRQLDAYCGCAADHYVEAATGEELRSFAQSGRPTASLQEKLETAALACRQTAKLSS